MVAIAGTGWKLAPSLARLVKEVDQRYPTRPTLSDGSIGDAAHATRSSFHNPLDGYVDAVDLTHGPVFDAHTYADTLVARQPFWMDHVISNKRIASRKTVWKWTPYTGPNPHTQHVHFAVQRNQLGRFSTVPWFEEDDVMTPYEHQLLEDLHVWMSEQGKPMAMRVAAIQAQVNILAAATGVDPEALEEAVKQALREGTG